MAELPQLALDCSEQIKRKENHINHKIPHFDTELKSVDEKTDCRFMLNINITSN